MPGTTASSADGWCEPIAGFCVTAPVVEYELAQGRTEAPRLRFGQRKVVHVPSVSVLGQVEAIPTWLGAALVAAVIAALGYVGRLVIDEWRIWRTHRAANANLLSLKALLEAAGVAFAVQAELRDRLWEMLAAYPEVPDDEGYERYFSSLHHDFSTDEMEIHRVIRYAVGARSALSIRRCLNGSAPTLRTERRLTRTATWRASLRC